jgi:hypothetical protein
MSRDQTLPLSKADAGNFVDVVAKVAIKKCFAEKYSRSSTVLDSS